MGETEVKGLRRQKPGSGGNAARPRPPSRLPQQLSAASLHAAQPKLELLQTKSSSEQQGKGRVGKHALLCQQSLPLVLPAVGVQRLVARAGGSPKAELSFSLPSIPFPLLVIFFAETRAHSFGGREEQAQRGSCRWAGGISSALRFHGERRGRRARDGGQTNI